MSDYDPTNFEGRMRALEIGLSELARRIRSLEQTLGASAGYQGGPPPFKMASIEPPPIQAHQAGPPVPPHAAAPSPGSMPPSAAHAPAAPQFSPYSGQVKQAAGPAHPVPPPADAAQIEYNLGAKVLPWAGAIVMLVAIGYFVSVGIQRGWINAYVQFGSAMFVSWAFIAVGFWKREEREEFGKLLIGIGSCGVYLTLAAGHLFMKPMLYEGEPLVAMFLAWSLVNLAYSYVASSRSFLAIGLIGGLAAALMPLDRGNCAMNVTLHFAIVLPALAIAAKNRWTSGVAGIWVASAAAMLPISLGTVGHPGVELRVFSLFGNSLAACLAYGLSGTFKDFDPEAAFSPALLVLSGLAGLGIMHESSHLGTERWMYVLLFGLVSAMSGFAMPDRLAKERLWLGGAALAAVITPLGLEDAAPCWVYMAIAVAAGLLSTQVAAKPALAIAWLDLGLSMCFYTWRATIENPFRYELLLLLCMVVSSVFLGWATNRAKEATEAIVSAVGVLLFAMIGRMAVVAAVDPSISFQQAASVVMVWVPMGAIFVGLGARRGWKGPMILGWAGVLTAIAVYFFTIISIPLSFGIEMSLLTLMVGGGAISAGLSAGRSKEATEAIVTSVGMLMFALLGRMAAVIAIHPSVGLPPSAAIIFVWVPMGAAFVGVGAKYRWKSSMILGWAGTVLAAAVYFGTAGTLSLAFRLELWLLLAMIAGAIASAVLTAAEEDAADGGLSVMAILLWALVTRLAVLVLAAPGVGMEKVWSVTISWTVFGAALLSAGFWTDRRVLRFWSFGVFGVTLGKLFLVDLSERIDPLGRVAILAGLGMALLAGGYWYVRNKGMTEGRDVPDPGSLPDDGIA